MPHPLVVNIHHKVPYDVNVMRPSKWGNPFVMGHVFTGSAHYAFSGEIPAILNKLVGCKLERTGCITVFEHWLVYDFNGLKLLSQIDELRGKILACCCAPKPCHADILAYWANI